MKFKFLVAAASLLAASAVIAAPHFAKVDDINSTTMQQMPSDNAAMPSDNSSASVAPGPMADASGANQPNVGAIPPSTTMPSDNSSSQDPSNMMSSNSMDPQSVSASTDPDMSADTTTGDDDY